MKFVAFLLLCGCAKHVPLERESGAGPGYVYDRFEDSYSVVARSKDALELALKKICKGKICTLEPVGTAYLVRIEGSKQ